MLRSLYAKLAVALLALLGLVAVLYVGVGIYTSDLYLHEVRQKLHLELAPHLIDEGLLLSNGRVDPDALEHVIHMLMVINPSIEVYVLDPRGRVLAYSAPPGKLLRETVSLEPVTRFLVEDARLPILGDDPRDSDGRKVFSAAPIGDANRPDGYVYVVLGGQLYDTVVERVAGSYVLRMGVAAGVAGLLFALAAGLLLFRRLTRRLRRLSTAMAEFETTGVPPALPAEASGARYGDEIDRLDRGFRRMAGRISEQLAQLERGDRMRRELVANVSHDLRTPLAALHGYLETLALKGEQVDPEERRRYLEIATRHSGKLGERIAELFELAKLDACDVKLQCEPFSLAELVQDVAQKFQIEAGRKQVQLHTDRERDLPFVEADIGLMERALENLVGNAIRHTPGSGHVTVSVDGDDSRVRVQVRDTGTGIPPEELPLVFDRFYRCHDEAANDEGSGLGLAIAKRIVELHEGTIQATSRIGEGSVFAFSLPPAGGPALS
jgi:signal transduction histidine kinase